MSASWEFLQQFHLNPPPFGVLPRKKKTEEAYARHKARLAKVGLTLDGHIFKNVLKEHSRFTITPNNFPYDLEDGIKHYLVWLHPEESITEKEVLNIIEKHFKEKAFVCYQNHTTSRSVKHIDHYQVFIKEY